MIMGELPDLALSVRQPWAWAIIHAGKDIENRTRRAITLGGMEGERRIAVHASSGMTREEYEEAREFMLRLGAPCPRPDELVRGAIIGAVSVVNVVKDSASPWFFGPWGLVLARPSVVSPIACGGELGLFRWSRNLAVAPRVALPWMLSWPDAPNRAAKREISPASLPLFSEGEE